MSTLRMGSSGPEVEAWQLFLIGQGFTITADGEFGPHTEEASIEFQKAHGLTADGEVGPKTLAIAKTLGFVEAKTQESTSNKQTSADWPPLPTFKSIVGNERRQAAFGKFSYVAAPVPGNQERIIITDDWPKKNIVEVVIPQLKGIPGAPVSGKIRFHKDGVQQLLGLWKAWGDAGLLPLVLTWNGAWSPRFVRKRTTLSNHAFGSAFDINYKWNLLGYPPALVSETGSVRKLVPLANQFGFYWGGHWGAPWNNSRADGMHFELAVMKEIV